ncbi:hypothetical protein ABW20_dc0101552 [Dactylellina cionopaga]|nr:hypothetical protein ABW20_dc0101552 [Dactylellina cionopaga]
MATANTASGQNAMLSNSDDSSVDLSRLSGTHTERFNSKRGQRDEHAHVRAPTFDPEFNNHYSPEDTASEDTSDWGEYYYSKYSRTDSVRQPIEDYEGYSSEASVDVDTSDYDGWHDLDMQVLPPPPRSFQPWSNAWWFEVPLQIRGEHNSEARSSLFQEDGTADRNGTMAYGGDTVYIPQSEAHKSTKESIKYVLSSRRSVGLSIHNDTIKLVTIPQKEVGKQRDRVRFQWM